MEDLISQFEKKYGVEQEEPVTASNSQPWQKDQYDYSDLEQEPEVIENEKVEQEVYSSDKQDHHALKTNSEKSESDGSYRIVTNTDNNSFNPDLEQMVISSVILNRPEF